MKDEDSIRLGALVKVLSAILGDQDPRVARAGSLTAAVLYCVCSGMSDDEIRGMFEAVLPEVRSADDAAGDGTGRAN